MKNEKIDTEQKIKEAARKVFMVNGLKGARMQVIADEAEINRAMLHYYFRSKEKLFEVIFQESMIEINGRIELILSKDTTIHKKIEHFVYSYMESASTNPEFELFLMNEFQQNPVYFKNMIQSAPIGQVLNNFIREIETAVKKKQIVGDARQIFLSIVSLCIFPFAAKTMVSTMMNVTDKTYQQLLKERADFLSKFILKGIQP
jgi:TetR/AcrR family transcriptional regulator